MKFSDFAAHHYTLCEEERKGSSSATSFIDPLQYKPTSQIQVKIPCALQVS